MYRATALVVLVALMVGCGKKAADTAPEKAETPKGGPPNPTPPADPNAGKPKDQPKVLSSLGVLKTGYPAGQGDRNQVHLSADGSIAAVYGVRQKKTQIWKVGAEPQKLKEFNGNVLSLSPDGKKFLRYGKEGQPPEIVNAETGAVIASLEHNSFFQTTFPSPDTIVGLIPGDWLEPKKPGILFVREYNAATGRMTGEFEIPTSFQGKTIVFLNHGKELLVGTRKENRVEFWDLVGKKKSREVTLANPPKSTSDTPWSNFAVSQDGKYIVLEHQSGNRIFDGTTGAELTPTDISDSTGSLVGTRGIYVYYRSVMDQKTRAIVPTYLAYDIKKAAVIATIPMPRDSLFHKLSANGNILVTECENGELTAWDLTQIP